MIIGISGKFGSGKDVVADTLVSQFGFIRMSMADALRDECRHALSKEIAPDCAPPDIIEIVTSGAWEPADLFRKPTPAPIRRLLQWWGTEYRRKQNPGYWVARMQERLNATKHSVAISDIRFENEAVMVNYYGGRVWVVQRDNRPGYDDPALHSHLSERFCDEYRRWDAVLTNNSSIESLQEKVCGVMRCDEELARIQKEMESPLSRKDESLGRTMGDIDWRVERIGILMT